MKVLIIGGDRRQLEIANILINKNIEVETFGIENTDKNIKIDKAYNDADAIILPLPVSRDDITINAPLCNDKIYIKDIINAKPKFVFGGLISENLEKELIRHNIPYYDYYKSEDITVKNAVLTAEAAVALAITEVPFSLYGANCLIIGYGRIGKSLANLLRVFGANVTVTSRNTEVLKQISNDGFTEQETNRVIEILSKQNIVFNTAPTNILNKEFFRNCDKNAIVFDLATNAGTDFKAAEYYGINAKLCGGLPGKFSPKTAARYIADEIFTKLNTEELHD